MMLHRATEQRKTKAHEQNVELKENTDRDRVIVKKHTKTKPTFTTVSAGTLSYNFGLYSSMRRSGRSHT